MQNEFPSMKMSLFDAESNSASNRLISIGGNSFLQNSLFHGASSMVLASHQLKTSIVSDVQDRNFVKS